MASKPGAVRSVDAERKAARGRVGGAIRRAAGADRRTRAGCEPPYTKLEQVVSLTERECV